jgi:hypothetical protein
MVQSDALLHPLLLNPASGFYVAQKCFALQTCVNPELSGRDPCSIRPAPMSPAPMCQSLTRATQHQRTVTMLARRDILTRGSLAALVLALAPNALAPKAWAQESKTALFKVVTSKDEIIIGLTTDELKALGGTDAAAVAHALAQKGDMAVWQYNVHRGANGELQESPTAKIGLIANSSLRVEPYSTTYAIVPHQ